MDVTEAHSYLDRARELQPMLAAAGDEIERHRQLPEAIVEALIERGIFKMLLPRSTMAWTALTVYPSSIQ